MGYSAVGLQAETNKISKKSYDELTKRFKRVVINFDDDDQGRTSTGDFLLQHDLEFFFVDKLKDISDHYKKYGYGKTNKLIKDKLK
jgi:hypothetical protein